MKSLKSGLLACFAIFSMMALKAQTVDEIINKHIDAIGGKDKVAGVKTLSIESTLEVMGNEAPSTTAHCEWGGL